MVSHCVFLTTTSIFPWFTKGNHLFGIFFTSVFLDSSLLSTVLFFCFSAVLLSVFLFFGFLFLRFSVVFASLYFCFSVFLLRFFCLFVLCSLFFNMCFVFFSVFAAFVFSTCFLVVLLDCKCATKLNEEQYQQHEQQEQQIQKEQQEQTQQKKGKQQKQQEQQEKQKQLQWKRGNKTRTKLSVCSWRRRCALRPMPLSSCFYFVVLCFHVWPFWFLYFLCAGVRAMM